MKKVLIFFEFFFFGQSFKDFIASKENISCSPVYILITSARRLK